jgi:hypothetical protein
MKQILLTFLLVFSLVFSGKSQLSNGTLAPDFALTDLNGNFHSLYGNYLNNGIDVIIDFSATWCGPCWNYHSSHTLANFYDSYGPNGTRDVTCFFIEGDLSTNEACLYGPSGCVGGTQGNWVAGTPYPIINCTSSNGPSTANQWGIAYWPTIYLVSSKNKRVYTTGGAPSSFTLNNWIFGSFKLDAQPVVTNAICGGDGAISLNVTAGYGTKTYLWSNGRTTKDISNLLPGNYQCTITDANQYRIVTNPINVGGIYTPLDINVIEKRQPNCYGGNNGQIRISGLHGNGNYSYLWENGSNLPTLSNLTAGQYRVTVFDVMNCSTESTITLGQPSALSSSVSAPQIPCTQTTGTATIAASGGVGPYTYNIGNGPQNSGVFPNLLPQTYEYTILDNKGCVLQNAFTLTSQPSPVSSASSSQPITCAVLQTQVTGQGSSSGNNVSYLWTTQDGHIVSGHDQLTAIVDEGGTYSLLVSDNSTGCSAVSAATVNTDIIHPELTVGSGGTITCTNREVELCASSESGLVITWNINGQQHQGECVNVSEAGTYPVSVTGNNGCITAAQSVVDASTTLPEIAIETPELLTCNREQIILQSIVQGNPDDFTLLWTTTDGNILSDAESFHPIVDAQGNYNLQVTNTTTGCVSNQEIFVEENNNTADGINTSSVTIINDVYNQNQGAITIQLEDAPDDISFLWSSGQTTQNIAELAPGAYSCTVTDANGCSKVFGPFNVSNTSGTNDAKYVNNFSVYPNPASNIVNLEVDLVKQESVTVGIYTDLGVLISTKKYNGNISDKIYMNDFASGFYFICVKGADFSIIRKLIIIK